jgi:hypothetical protein
VTVRVMACDPTASDATGDTPGSDHRPGLPPHVRDDGAVGIGAARAVERDRFRAVAVGIVDLLVGAGVVGGRRLIRRYDRRGDGDDRRRRCRRRCS